MTATRYWSAECIPCGGGHISRILRLGALDNSNANVFAYVADVTQEHQRTTAYGLVSATFAASLVTSPAIGAYLSASYGDSLVVLVATLVAVVDICFILLAVPESLPEKIRPASWGSSISWEQADPFASLKKVRKDPTVLPICITVLLSYLPEAGQYSSFFLYLRQIIGFGSASIAAFIAVVGILSIIAQVETIRTIRKNYFFTKMMWAAGAVAAMSSITFPAISALVSRNAEADQQGVVQGIITGVRGLCNGLGPALYGFIFFLFHVELNELLPDNTSEKKTKQNPSDKRLIIPGPPFLVGACIVLLAFLVALFIPESSKASSTKKHSNSISSSLGNNLDQSNEEDIEPLLQDSSLNCLLYLCSIFELNFEALVLIALSKVSFHIVEKNEFGKQVELVWELLRRNTSSKLQNPDLLHTKNDLHRLPLDFKGICLVMAKFEPEAWGAMKRRAESLGIGCLVKVKKEHVEQRTGRLNFSQLISKLDVITVGMARRPQMEMWKSKTQMCNGSELGYDAPPLFYSDDNKDLVKLSYLEAKYFQKG
ncbi:hypothetical protein IHE44_0011325 [Lamprotornis superbus]|uniref:Uncharacterized protein n=1 Tax=Lamprotornis superbus TaxID=245042 RepID=A0A835NPZ8_9PASS|nr:hypothetical protein IHE44_0011325 [Lamprotornis superbus]